MTRAQLLDAGLTRGVIDYLVKCGFLHPLHRGVYAVAHLALPPLAPHQAALFACGDGAVISHRSALHLWGLVAHGPAVLDVTVRRHCRSTSGVHTYRRPLNDQDVRTRRGLPITSPARSLIDYANEATGKELEDAVAEARVQRLIRDGELEKALERAGRRRGAARMRAFLAAEGGPAITRSRAEREFRNAIQQSGLPQPQANARVAGFEVDFLWKAEKVVLEVDGWRYHGHRRAFERDRKKGMVLGDAGYHVSRVTWSQFTDELLYVIAHLARTLDRRARTAG